MRHRERHRSERIWWRSARPRHESALRRQRVGAARVALWGAIALVATAAIGKLFGATVA
jgi:hypothetical protein